MKILFIMGKYAKLFNAQREYDIYINGNPYLPNVSYIETTQEVKYNPIEPIHDYSQDYLTFKVLEDGTFKFTGYDE